MLAEGGRGPHRLLVGLDGGRQQTGAQRAAVREGGRQREIGSVTSAAWSPTCKRNIALAMVDAPYFRTGSAVWADIYLNRELVWERRMSRAEVVERPFFRAGPAPATPPASLGGKRVPSSQPKSIADKPCLIPTRSRKYSSKHRQDLRRVQAVDGVSLRIYQGRDVRLGGRLGLR